MGSFLFIASPEITAGATWILNMNFILPEVLLIAGGLLTMIISAFPPVKRLRGVNFILTALIFAAATAASLHIAGLEPASAFGGMIRSDLFSGMLNVIYCVSGLLVTLIAHSYFTRRGRYVYETYPLLLFSASGMMFMTAGTDLMVIFLGLEILSVSLYVLTGIDYADRWSNESSVKYFLMGVFASAFLLYGIALVYGATGTTSLRVIYAFINGGSVEGIYISAGIILILAGFGFKISMVPFHMWTPDVYQGAPLVITAFISTAPKAAALLAFTRIILVITPPSGSEWLPGIIAILSVLTMTVGNLMALNQQDIKRILAFSSISHVGYMLVALSTFRTDAAAAILFYFTAYILMNTGLFAILSAAADSDDRNLTLEGIQGLARRKPAIGGFLLVFTFSLAGLPPTAGFPAKFFIFSTAVESGMYYLAIAGVLNSAVSAYYYLRILLHAYIKDPGEDQGFTGSINLNAACLAVIITACAGTIWLGITPSGLIDLARSITFR